VIRAPPRAGTLVLPSATSGDGAGIIFAYKAWPWGTVMLDEVSLTFRSPERAAILSEPLRDTISTVAISEAALM